MKKEYLFLLIMAIAAFVAGFGARALIGRGTASDPSSEIQSEQVHLPEFYTCSMHPQIQETKPGKCRLCGMELIPVTTSTGSGASGASGARELTMSPAAIKRAEVETAFVERKFVSASVRMVGKVEYDETRLAYITARVPGRLDRLFVDYTGVAVQEGDHLVELYSPELLQAQEELLSAAATVATVSGNASKFLRERQFFNLESAREKLRLWGLGEAQIREIEQQGQSSDHITINSPIAGVVVEKHAVEGLYVETGSRVYTIADLSEVWVKLDAYESDLHWLRYGQEVEFRTEAYPGEIFTGQIAFIDPILNARTRTIKIRVNLPNPEGKLKPDMFVRAVVKSQVAAGGRVMDLGLAGKWISPMHPEIVRDQPGQCDVCGMDLVSAESLGFVAAQSDSAPLVIPATAPLITGRRAVVYVALGEGRFEGREIVLGPRAGEYYLVDSGLKEGERVVTKGNFKIDSALQILAKPSMMQPMDSREPAKVSFAASREFRQRIGNLVRGYVKIKDGLSHDNYSEAVKHASDLREQLLEFDLTDLSVEGSDVWKGQQSRLSTGLKSLAMGEQLESARTAFRSVSEALVSMVREFGGESESGIHLYHCPMAFEGEGGDWLQTELGVENPYYGSAMFSCGRLTATLAEGSGADENHEGHHHE